MSTIEHYAGVESAVRLAAEAAMAESRPMPEWKETELRREEVEHTQTIHLTKAANVRAWSYTANIWWPSFHVNLALRNVGVLTDAIRADMLRDALAAIDEARPVLVSLIEAAERATP